MASLQGYNPYTTTFNTGQYRHIALCISGNTQTLYLDGSVLGTVTNNDILSSGYSTINQLTIGCAGDKSSAFAGYMDDFRAYNYAMTPTQISNLYTNKNMIKYYTFDNCSNNVIGNYATLVYDLSYAGLGINSKLMQNSAIIVPDGGLNGMKNLYLNNTSTVSGINAYAYSNTSISTASDSNGFSISFWFDTSGTLNKIQRIVDLAASPYYNSLFIDISGTNSIYSGYANHNILSTATNYLQLNGKLLTDIGTNPATVTDVNTTVSTHLNKRCIQTAGGIMSSTTWVSIPITLPTQYTICFWGYDVKNGSSNQALLGIRTSTNGHVLSLLSNDGGNNNCYIYFTDLIKTTFYNGRPRNAWVHYAVTIDQTSTTLSSLYINGVLQRSITVASPYTISSTSHLLYIGKCPDNYTNGSDGYFYGLCTFSSILDATQITEVMNSTSSNNYTGFVGLTNPGFATSASGWTVTTYSTQNYAAIYGTDNNVLYGSFSGWAASPVVSPPYSTSYSSQLGGTGEYVNFMQKVMLYSGSYTFSIYAGGRPGGDGTFSGNYYNTNQVFQIYIDTNKVAQFTAPMLSDGITVAGFNYVTANFTITESRIYEFHFRVAQIGQANLPTVAYTGATITRN